MIERTEPIEVSDCCGWTDGGREEDGKGPVPPEDEEALISGGGKDEMTEGETTEDEMTDEEVPRLTRGDEVGAWAAGMLLIGESRGLT